MITLAQTLFAAGRCFLVDFLGLVIFVTPGVCLALAPILQIRKQDSLPKTMGLVGGALEFNLKIVIASCRETLGKFTPFLEVLIPFL